MNDENRASSVQISRPSVKSSDGANDGGLTQRGIDSGRISRFMDGDESAFEEIMDDNRGRIFAVALNLLRNRGDAEEIVQDTFVRAHRSLPSFRQQSSLRTWLYRIAVNLSHNRYWHSRRRFAHATISLEDPMGGPDGSNSRVIAELIASGAADPADEAGQHEFLQITMRCIALLDQDHRMILVQRFLNDSTYGEIGESLGIRTGTVKSRLARARKCLRRRLADTCPELTSAARNAPGSEEGKYRKHPIANVPPLEYSSGSNT